MSSENGGHNPPRLARSKKQPAKKTLEIVWLTRDEIPPVPDTVSDRIEFIADTMSDLKWQRGKTGKLIANQWGLSVSTVEGYAAEASRLVIGNREVAQRDITAGAVKLFTAAVHIGDAKSAKMMGDLLAAVSGAAAPQKQEIAHSIGAATPKTAREVMATLFKGNVGENVAVDSDTLPEPVSELESNDVFDSGEPTPEE